MIYLIIFGPILLSVFSLSFSVGVFLRNEKERREKYRDKAPKVWVDGCLMTDTVSLMIYLEEKRLGRRG